jgi:hypothetical protein
MTLFDALDAMPGAQFVVFAVLTYAVMDLLLALADEWGRRRR